MSTLYRISQAATGHLEQNLALQVICRLFPRCVSAVRSAQRSFFWPTSLVRFFPPFADDQASKSIICRFFFTCAGLGALGCPIRQGRLGSPCLSKHYRSVLDHISLWCYLTRSIDPRDHRVSSLHLRDTTTYVRSGTYIRNPTPSRLRPAALR